MGQMNIKDAALIAEAKALAELIGTSTTEAVRQAVHEALLRRQQAEVERKQRKFEAIMAIARDASKLFPPGSTSDHSDLYDENGLPK